MKKAEILKSVNGVEQVMMTETIENLDQYLDVFEWHFYVSLEDLLEVEDSRNTFYTLRITEGEGVIHYNIASCVEILEEHLREPECEAELEIVTELKRWCGNKQEYVSIVTAEKCDNKAAGMIMQYGVYYGPQEPTNDRTDLVTVTLKFGDIILYTETFGDENNVNKGNK